MKIVSRYLFFLAFLLNTNASNAQSYINNQLTPVQGNANFTISGDGRASRFFTAAGTHASGVGHISLHTTDFEITARRWNIGLSGVESSGNVGSNFSIWGYGDTGSYLYTALTIQRSNGYVGIGTAAPEAKFHVNAPQGIPLARFTQSNVLPANGYMNIQNITGSTGLFIPALISRSHAPGRPFGLYLIGEAEDIVPITADTAVAAVIIDGRNKAGAKLVNNNLLAINSYGQNYLMVKGNGSVGIGTTDTKGYKLAVNGSGIFTKVKVKTFGAWPDYVFEDGFPLRSLDEVNTFIKLHKHLPDMPSAAEVNEEGIDLGEMNRKLLQKIEEQTLYIIKMNEDMKLMKQRILDLENQIK